MLRLASLDDDKDILEQVKNIINENFSTSISADYFDTVDKLDKSRNFIEYDIYVLDIEIGDDNGLNYAKSIRETSLDSAIIFITSHPQYAIEGYSVRAIDYIMKPFDDSDLIKVVKEQLDRLRKPGTFYQ